MPEASPESLPNKQQVSEAAAAAIQAKTRQTLLLSSKTALTLQLSS